MAVNVVWMPNAAYAANGMQLQKYTDHHPTKLQWCIGPGSTGHARNEKQTPHERWTHGNAQESLLDLSAETQKAMRHGMRRRRCRSMDRTVRGLYAKAYKDWRRVSWQWGENSIVDAMISTASGRPLSLVWMNKPIIASQGYVLEVCWLHYSWSWQHHTKKKKYLPLRGLVVGFEKLHKNFGGF
jgi:hypothetical protein